MESATILMPPSTGLTLFCFSSEPNIPEGLEYENISTLYARGENSYSLWFPMGGENRHYSMHTYLFFILAISFYFVNCVIMSCKLSFS